MTSMRKLASLAGVSASTVSRALRNDPRLRPETVERVRKLAELYQYQPYYPALPVSGKQAQVIGCVIPLVSSPFFGLVLEGALGEAFRYSYRVITLQTDADYLNTRKALQTLVEQGVEGVLISSGNSSPLPDVSLFDLWSHGIHTVGLEGTPTDTPIDQVLTDEMQVAAMVIDYLCDLGHREIAYLGPLVDVLTRGKAIRQVLKRRGLSSDWCWEALPPSCLDEMLACWQSAPVAPTALVAYSDLVAAEFLLHAARRRLAVPGEISVIGYANVRPLCDYLFPPLTTVEQHPVEIGRRAFAQLLRRITSGKQPGDYAPDTITVSADLVIRESCSHPRRSARL